MDDRAIHDTMASMIVHQVFTRHPKLKVASIENGSYFVYRLDQAAQEGRPTPRRTTSRKTRWNSCATTSGSRRTTRTT